MIYSGAEASWRERAVFVPPDKPSDDSSKTRGLQLGGLDVDFYDLFLWVVAVDRRHPVQSTLVEPLEVPSSKHHDSV